MNKTVVFVTFACLVAVGIVGSVALYIHRPDATATFTGQLMTLLGLVVTAARTFAAIGSVAKKVEEVRHQTNGTLTGRDEKIEALEAELSEYRTRGQRRMERAAHRADDGS